FSLMEKRWQAPFRRTSSGLLSIAQSALPGARRRKANLQAANSSKNCRNGPILYNFPEEQSLNLLGGRYCVHLSRLLFALGVISFFSLATSCRGGGGGADVVAKVNGRPITRAEVDKYYENQAAGSQQPTGEQANSFRLSILRNLIDNE